MRYLAIQKTRTSYGNGAKMKRAAVLFLCLSIAACATNLQRGNTHYQRGEYDQAASYWSPLAIGGDSGAQYNVGLLWEFGLGSTQKSPEMAAQWYLKAANQGFSPAMFKIALYQLSSGYHEPALTWLHLASRLGNSDAIEMLATLGEPIPQPDLLNQQLREQQAQQKREQEKFNRALGAVLAVGAAAYSGSTGGSASYTDSDWAWDAFYDEWGNLQWRCRGIQTGQFAEDYECLYDAKNDTTWPNK